MIEYRIHYLITGGVRCGQPRRRNWTHDPVKVTCLSCQKLMSKEMK